LPTEFRPGRFLRTGAWLIALLVGFTHAWATRFWLSPDALNYLDVSSAYLRHDFHSALNAYWSPAFSWILAGAISLFHPAPHSESTLLHLVNFAGLLFSLAAFEFFFISFLAAQENLSRVFSTSPALSDSSTRLLGYAIFFSTSFFLLADPSSTTPDVWLVAETWLIAGLLLRIFLHRGGWNRFALLGLALGCAYLTKTFYFPLVFVFLPAAWIASGATRKTLLQAAAALAIFAAIATPWIAAISAAKHRFTIGDVGKLALVINYADLGQPPFWQGENGSGTPAHPVHLILTSPRVFEFASPIGGTYPPGYDWSYWMEGVRPHFCSRAALRVFRQSAGTFFKLALAQSEFAVAALVLFFCAPNKRRILEALRFQSFLWLPPLAACAAYAVVLVEGRYVAPFAPLLWLAAFSCLLAQAGLSTRAARALVLAAVCFTGLRLAKFTEENAAAIFSAPRNTDADVAAALRQAGVRPGDGLALLCPPEELHWARQLGARIVSEMPLGQESVFWPASDDVKSRVFSAFASSGAKFVITMDPPLGPARTGWLPLAQTDFFAHPLSRSPRLPTAPYH